jgi:hypothetical protein
MPTIIAACKVTYLNCIIEERCKVTINVPLFKKWLIKLLSHKKKIMSQSFLSSGTLVILCIRVLLCTVVVCCCLLLGVLVCCCVLL